MNKFFFSIILIVIIVGVILILVHNFLGIPREIDQSKVNQGNLVFVTNFQECVQAGNAVMESYPRQCRNQDGETFVEDIGNELEKIDFIRVNSPRPNQIINSPLVIEGEARGTWFFEGTFPIKIFDGEGNIISKSYATAQGDWMTEDFVGFRAEIEFKTPHTLNGVIILEEDNPSDLPEYSDELRMPVFFE